MAFDFHQDRSKYFKLQWNNSKEYIFPLVKQYIDITPDTKVLEIGCKGGGVLMPFYELGSFITGIDVSEPSLQRARQSYDPSKSSFIYEDIHKYVEREDAEKFDVILLKDTIEHIPNQAKLIPDLKKILAKSGVIYFGFPPWQNPYGGHQQMCTNKLCAYTPYYHLLPNFIYLNIVKLLSPKSYAYLKITKETRITPEQFERYIGDVFKIYYSQFYLISPMYKYKFGLKPVKQFKFIAAIPYIRNFFTTTCDYVVG